MQNISVGHITYSDNKNRKYRLGDLKTTLGENGRVLPSRPFQSWQQAPLPTESTSYPFYPD